MLLCQKKQALRYGKDRPTLETMDEVIYQEALDETGTVPIPIPTESNNDSATLRKDTVEWEEEGTVDIDEELLRLHGIYQGKKTRRSHKNNI